jgi:hypothetical protein
LQAVKVESQVMPKKNELKKFNFLANTFISKPSIKNKKVGKTNLITVMNG